MVIAGAPNVGKSSLFNALLGRRRAIVTDVPGTTRDALEALTEAGGWPIRLVDTAGLRETSELVERLGIEVSREYLEKADLVLACGDSDESVSRTHAAVARLAPAPTLDVRTKSDLMPAAERSRGDDNGHVLVSAETGEGLDTLARRIGAMLVSTKGQLSFDAPVVARARHRVALEQARTELLEFRDAWSVRAIPPVVAAVHLRHATHSLEELIGAVDVEDVLDRVFSSFCVGK